MLKVLWVKTVNTVAESVLFIFKILPGLTYSTFTNVLKDKFK